MTTYSDWDQRLLDQRSGLEGDRRKAHARRVLAFQTDLEFSGIFARADCGPDDYPSFEVYRGLDGAFYWNSLDRYGDPVGPESEPFPTAEDAYNDAGGV
jgi:hypothetical protein